jgi:hypothetical protein
MFWADEIQNLEQSELERTTRGPFLCDPRGRLLLLNEMIRRVPKDEKRLLPQGPSQGWVRMQTKDYSAWEIWCPLGGEQIILEGKLPAGVVASTGGTLNLSISRVMQLLASGGAFLFNNLLFLLPEHRFAWNSFSFHPADYDEPLSVLVGYRGHAQNYAEILTPSLLRHHRHPTDDKYLAYKKVETYAANIIKEVFWKQKQTALTDIQARGILQHHKILGDTDLLDLTHNVQVAKWFALHSVTNHGATRKRFAVTECKTEDDFWKAYDESSLIYQIVVRILGGSNSLNTEPALSGEPMDIKPFPSGPLHLLPWNLDLPGSIGFRGW